MTRKTIGFIGGGRVAHILLAGWQKAGELPQQIIVSDSNPQVLNRLKEWIPQITTTGDNQSPAGQDLVFLALHPVAVGDILEKIASALKPGAWFVSLAPKLSIAKLSIGLGGFNKIARIIPNAPSILGIGYNPVAFSSAIPAEEKTELLALFQSLGESPQVTEEKLEAYAILTAMGPTYFWFQWQEMLQLGLSFGLERSEIETGLTSMINGAVNTLFASGLSPETVMDLVPVRPLSEDENAIREMYHNRLEPLYKKLKG